ncbi:3'-5' exonuclease, partial [Miniimonas arenae]|uniref:3'-5' exonuclease n=1 Tax=Miniimonas arenae TaxID=676201 RepID=UPI0028A92FE0
EADAGSSVDVAVLRSVPEEARAIARGLREHHLREGTPWDEMAVLARSTGQLGALRRGLRAAGVPVATAQGEVPLAAEPAVRPLLRALEVVSAQVEREEREAGADLEEGAEHEGQALLEGDALLEGEAAALVELLLSPLGGLDPVGLRALRRALRSAEAADGGTRGSDALLVEAVRAAGELEAMRRAPRAAGAVRRVGRVLAAGRLALTRAEGLEQVLWALWQTSGLAAVWRQRALGTGAGAERADADLDAVIALFRAAEAFAVQQEGARPADFLRYLTGQQFAADTLARTGQRRAVEVMTAAAAAGREWDVVAVAGVQEDVWPDLRLRARLLDPVAISDLAAGRGAEPQRPVDARRAVLADEQRVLVAAVSRARAHLLVTAV